jgi:hemerythrin superfamily protein
MSHEFEFAIHMPIQNQFYSMACGLHFFPVSTEEFMEIYEVLKKDHRKLEKLLDELVALPEGGKTHKHLIEKVRDELVPHARAEEAVFYNSLRSIEGVKDLVMHSYKEHMEAETMLRLLQVKEKVDMDWKKSASQLRAAIAHHVEEEEGKVMPAAQKVLSDEEARKLAVAFERLKPEVREEGFMKNTLDMIANLMPPRFTKSAREYEREKSA